MIRLVSLIPFLVVDASAAEPTPFSADAAVAFGDHLFRKDDPFNALTWYELASFAAPNLEPSPLLFRKALCYERGERWSAAERAWLDLAAEGPSWRPRATYRAGLVLLAQGETGVARLHLQEVRLDDPDSPWAPRSLYAEGLTRLEEGEGGLAALDFAAFAQAHPDHELAEQARGVSSLLNEPVARRSPALAAVMSSVLPGAGQVYAGHAGDGFMAFLAAGALGAWSGTLLYYGVENEETWALASGSALGSLALFNWVSNVAGAARGAKRTTARLQRQQARGALEAAAHPSLELDARDVLLPALPAAAPIPDSEVPTAP